MRLVIIESPYAGDIPRNTLYAKAAVRDSIFRGEAPFASHLIYPGALNEAIAEERSLGIKCGLEWWRCVSAVCFYIDLGWSPGMQTAYKLARTERIKIEERSLADNPH